jgi:superfamily II DNA or RNA helicase
MAVNISNSELKETQGKTLPSVSLKELQQMREEQCSNTSNDFKLQNYQRFLRRVLSPDSPVKNLLVVHGTGTGKTCTAIQISEEYITRPEFQNKTVLVLANPAVQDNFKNQIFNISKVSVDNGILQSKQCTGRRYLDMILRVQNEPMRWTDPQVREKISKISDKLIKEFYEFQGYQEFSNKLNNQKEIGNLHTDTWIHNTFDNRMIIIDEAHSLRATDEGIELKAMSRALQEIVSKADNLILILLTATPMFDDYTEILYYFNLFLLNDRKIKTFLKTEDVFDLEGKFQEGMEKKFRGWCQDYISYVRGDNPLTFPFRLPPSKEFIAPPATIDWETGKTIPLKERRNILTLTGSYVKGIQKKILTSQELRKSGPAALEQILCAFPENNGFSKTFVLSTEQNSNYKYSKNVPKFLSPSMIAEYSSKFALITKIISESEGIIFVYSNLVKYGAELFAMCLEEHGYSSALDNQILENISEEVPKGSKGKYAIFTSNISEGDRRRLLDRLKLPSNSNGQDVKIIIGSKAIAEGIDMSYVRQIHILDFWWNMSRIEQAVGRGIRTCSHSRLPFEKQNCTVYLHICKVEGSEQELIDERYYRTIVEYKGKSIALIKNIIMESAMDCPLQTELNNLPVEWRNMEISQTSSYKNQVMKLKLNDLASPLFGEVSSICKTEVKPKDPDHERPLSAYLDVRDEILDKFLGLFLRKPIWTLDDLHKTPELNQYEKDVLVYTLQSAIESGFKLKDKNGRTGTLESKGKVYAFTTGKYISLQDRIIARPELRNIPLKVHETEEKKGLTLQESLNKFKWIGDTKERFPKEVLEWYILDHIMHPKQRLEHMLNLNWKNPPIYARPLKTKHFKILGSGQIYEGMEKIVPIGEQKDEYMAWVENLKDSFIEKKENYFAAMEKQNIKFNIEKGTTLKRAERSKNIGGRACGTAIPDTVLNLFAEWLGMGFPDYIKVKKERCLFLSLLIRHVVIQGKKGIDWWTPEEWAILQEDDNRKDLIMRLKD